MSRRSFLATTLAAVGAGMATSAGAVAPPGAKERDIPKDATKVQGEETWVDGGYGSRSQFETEIRTRFKTATNQG